MKCIVCNKGKLKLEMYKHNKKKGRLVCDNCGHKEIF